MKAPQTAIRAGEPPPLVNRVPKDARPGSAGGQGLSRPGGVVVFRRWAGCAALGAGLVHLAAVSEHVSEWWLYGPFFLVLGVVQIGWAVQAMEGDLPFPRVFAAMNAAVIGLWFVSRTTGLPVGPEPWAAEAVGTADLLCSALEAAVVVLLVLATRRPQVQESAPTKVQRRMIAVGAVAAAAVTLAALAANPPVRGHATHHPPGIHSEDAEAPGPHDHHPAEPDLIEDRG